MFQVSFFSLLLAASSIVISGQEQQSFSQLPEQDNNSITEPTGFLTYQNITYGITMLQYPSDWEGGEFEQDPSASYHHQIAGFYSPRLSITDPYQEFVGISVEELNENMTLDQYFEIIVAPYNGSEFIPASQVISYSDDVFLTNNNYPAYQVEFTDWDAEASRQLRIIEGGTIVEGKAYKIMYFAYGNNEFSQFLPIAQQMIDSFEINEAKRTRGLVGTMPDPGSQYLELKYEEWRSDNINVMIAVNPDTEEQSSKYVDEVENAINSWSQALKEYSGNPNAWNFNVGTSVDYVSSIEIGPGREADLVIELTGDPEDEVGCGTFGLAPPELTIPATVHVLTSCLDAETDELTEYPEEIVYSTALHEFAHSLGLGHAFNISNDLMCSSEPDANGNDIPTCEHYEADVEEISEADVAALVYKYGIDGFEPPNAELRGPIPYYEVASPIAVNGTETSGSPPSTDTVLLEDNWFFWLLAQGFLAVLHNFKIGTW